MLIGASAVALGLMTPAAAEAQVTIPTLPPVAPPPTTVPPPPTVPPSTQPAPRPTDPSQPAPTAPPSSTAVRPTTTPTGAATATSAPSATSSTAATSTPSPTGTIAVLPRPRSASELATRTLHSAGDFTIPFVLGALVALFLLVQGRVHQGDAKLTAAPLTSDDALRFK